MGGHSDVKAPSGLDIALGANIRDRRKRSRISQTVLADAVGVTFQQIQKYERGFNRVSFSRLVAIAHVLSCRVEDLIGDIEAVNASASASAIESAESRRFRADSAYLRVGGARELMAAYAAAPAPMKRVLLHLVVEIARDRSARAPAAEGVVRD